MPRWSAGRRWGLVAGALLVLVVAAVGGFMLASTTLRLTFLTPNPSTGCLKRYENARSQPGRGISLFQRIWMMRTASQKVRANMRKCVAAVILRPA